MEPMYVPLPLYPDPDYNYYVSLQRVAYKLRFYFNERMQQWIINLYYADDTPIIEGEAVVAQYPMFLDYDIEPSGFFWLEPVGKYQNETVSNPYDITRYFNLFYYYMEEVEEEE